MSAPIPFDDYGGQGPLLHFAHANGYPPACYRRLIAALTDHYHVLAVHHRPLWPGSQPEELNNWHLIGDDLLRFFDQQGLEGVIGVGHSLGAVATMYAALQQPEAFRALVLIEPVFLMPAILSIFAMQPAATLSEDYPLVKIASSRRNEWPSRQEAFQHFRPKRVFAHWSDEALWDYIWHGFYKNEAGDVVLSYSPQWEARIYALPPTDVWELIPRVTHPTLGLRGKETDTLAPAAWELWQMAQPQATFVEIAGASHLLPIEKPAEVADRILAFLDRLAP